MGYFVAIPLQVQNLLYIPFIALIPYYARVFSSYWNVGRLSIRQFLLEKSSQIPNYSWLRMGLGIVEERLLETKGLALPRNRLFHGSSYAIFKELPIDSTLESLAEWVNKPKASTAHSLVEELLKSSKQAKELDMEITPTTTEKMIRLPWREISYLLTAISVSIGILVSLLRSVGIM